MKAKRILGTLKPCQFFIKPVDVNNLENIVVGGMGVILVIAIFQTLKSWSALQPVEMVPQFLRCG